MTINDQLLIIRGSVIYDVSDLLAYASEGNDGWGMPPIRRLTEQGAQQDGVTDRGFRLLPRILNLRIRTQTQRVPDPYKDYFDKREALLEIFKPDDAGLSVRRVVAGRVRQLDGHLIDGARFASEDAAGLEMADVFSIMAPNPVLYDPTGEATDFNLGSSSGLAIVYDAALPYDNAIPYDSAALVGGGSFIFSPGLAFNPGVEFGGSTLDQTRALVYLGSWRSFPVITLIGPLTDPKIEHLTRGLVLDFSGYSIPEGGRITLDLAFDRKTIVDEAGNNLESKLSNASNKGAFALEAAPVAPGGVNDLRVTGFAANAQTHVQLQWLNRYIGM